MSAGVRQSYDGTVAAGTDVIDRHDWTLTRRAFLWRKDVWEATGEVTPFDGFGDFESYSSEISRDGTAVYVTGPTSR